MAALFIIFYLIGLALCKVYAVPYVGGSFEKFTIQKIGGRYVWTRKCIGNRL